MRSWQSQCCREQPNARGGLVIAPQQIMRRILRLNLADECETGVPCRPGACGPCTAGNRTDAARFAGMVDLLGRNAPTQAAQTGANDRGRLKRLNGVLTFSSGHPIGGKGKNDCRPAGFGRFRSEQRAPRALRDWRVVHPYGSRVSAPAEI